MTWMAECRKKYMATTQSAIKTMKAMKKRGTCAMSAVRKMKAIK